MYKRNKVMEKRSYEVLMRHNGSQAVTVAAWGYYTDAVGECSYEGVINYGQAKEALKAMAEKLYDKESYELHRAEQGFRITMEPERDGTLYAIREYDPDGTMCYEVELELFQYI